MNAIATHRNAIAKVAALGKEFAKCKNRSAQSKITSAVITEACLGKMVNVQQIIDFICVGRSAAGLGSKLDPYRNLSHRQLGLALKRDAELIFGWFVLNCSTPKHCAKAYRQILAIQDGPKARSR